MVYIYISITCPYILQISHMATPESYCNRVFREINHPFEDTPIDGNTPSGSP
jgi:hypothetical protein